MKGNIEALFVGALTLALIAVIFAGDKGARAIGAASGALSSLIKTGYGSK